MLCFINHLDSAFSLNCLKTIPTMLAAFADNNQTTQDDDAKKYKHYLLAAAAMYYSYMLETNPNNAKNPQYYLELFINMMSNQTTDMADTPSEPRNYGTRSVDDLKKRPAHANHSSASSPLLTQRSGSTSKKSFTETDLVKWLRLHDTDEQAIVRHGNLEIANLLTTYLSRLKWNIANQRPQTPATNPSEPDTPFFWSAPDSGEDTPTQSGRDNLTILTINTPNGPLVVQNFNNRTNRAFEGLARGTCYPWIIADQPRYGALTPQKVHLGAEDFRYIQQVHLTPEDASSMNQLSTQEVKLKPKASHEDYMASLADTPYSANLARVPATGKSLWSRQVPYSALRSCQALDILRKLGDFTNQAENLKRDFFTLLAQVLGITDPITTSRTVTPIQQAEKYFILFLTARVYNQAGVVLTLPRHYAQDTFLKLSLLWDRIQYNQPTNPNQHWHSAPLGSLRITLSSTLEECHTQLQAYAQRQAATPSEAPKFSLPTTAENIEMARDSRLQKLLCPTGEVGAQSCETLFHFAANKLELFNSLVRRGLIIFQERPDNNDKYNNISVIASDPELQNRFLVENGYFGVTSPGEDTEEGKESTTWVCATDIKPQSSEAQAYKARLEEAFSELLSHYRTAHEGEFTTTIQQQVAFIIHWVGYAQNAEQFLVYLELLTFCINTYHCIDYDYYAEPGKTDPESQNLHRLEILFREAFRQKLSMDQLDLFYTSLSNFIKALDTMNPKDQLNSDPGYFDKAVYSFLTKLLAIFRSVIYPKNTTENQFGSETEEDNHTLTQPTKLNQNWLNFLTRFGFTYDTTPRWSSYTKTSLPYTALTLANLAAQLYFYYALTQPEKDSTPSNPNITGTEAQIITMWIDVAYTLLFCTALTAFHAGVLKKTKSHAATQLKQATAAFNLIEMIAAGLASSAFLDGNYLNGPGSVLLLSIEVKIAITLLRHGKHLLTTLASLPAKAIQALILNKKPYSSGQLVAAATIGSGFTKSAVVFGPNLFFFFVFSVISNTFISISALYTQLANDARNASDSSALTNVSKAWNEASDHVSYAGNLFSILSGLLILTIKDARRLTIPCTTKIPCGQNEEGRRKTCNFPVSPLYGLVWLLAVIAATEESVYYFSDGYKANSTKANQTVFEGIDRSKSVIETSAIILAIGTIFFIELLLHVSRTALYPDSFIAQGNQHKQQPQELTQVVVVRDGPTILAASRSVATLIQGGAAHSHLRAAKASSDPNESKEAKDPTDQKENDRAIHKAHI
jgi:hypothetical protein